MFSQTSIFGVVLFSGSVLVSLRAAWHRNVVIDDFISSSVPCQAQTTPALFPVAHLQMKAPQELIPPTSFLSSKYTNKQAYFITCNHKKMHQIVPIICFSFCFLALSDLSSRNPFKEMAARH